MRTLLLTLFLLLGSCPYRRLMAAELPPDASPLPLKPDVPARHRLAPISNEPLNNTQLFHLLDLQPSSHYEVRVSFLGTVSCGTAHALCTAP